MADFLDDLIASGEKELGLRPGDSTKAPYHLFKKKKPPPLIESEFVLSRYVAVYYRVTCTLCSAHTDQFQGIFEERTSKKTNAKHSIRLQNAPFAAMFSDKSICIRQILVKPVPYCDRCSFCYGWEVEQDVTP